MTKTERDERINTLKSEINERKEQIRALKNSPVDEPVAEKESE